MTDRIRQLLQIHRSSPASVRARQFTCCIHQCHSSSGTRNSRISRLSRGDTDLADGSPVPIAASSLPAERRDRPHRRKFKSTGSAAAGCTEAYIVYDQFDGGPLWVNRVVLATDRSLPVYLDKQTFSAPVGMSQRCQLPTNLDLGAKLSVRGAGGDENDRSATGFLPPNEFETVANQFLHSLL
jgi:hypothetical protein